MQPLPTRSGLSPQEGGLSPQEFPSRRDFMHPSPKERGRRWPVNNISVCFFQQGGMPPCFVRSNDSSVNSCRRFVRSNDSSLNPWRPFVRSNEGSLNPWRHFVRSNEGRICPQIPFGWVHVEAKRGFLNRFTRRCSYVAFIKKSPKGETKFGVSQLGGHWRWKYRRVQWK